MVYNFTPILQHHNQRFESCYVSSKASSKPQHISLFSLPGITLFIPNKAVKVLKLQVNFHLGLCYLWDIPLSPHQPNNWQTHIYKPAHSENINQCPSYCHSPRSISGQWVACHLCHGPQVARKHWSDRYNKLLCSIYYYIQISIAYQMASG